MTITYQETKTIDFDQLNNLYSSLGWTRYTEHPEKMKQMMHKSLYVSSAWDDRQLVGLIRVVGDDTSIIYIQDILVKPRYHGNQIGSHLLKQVLTRFAHIRQIVLITDDEEKNKAFYESLGMKNVNDMGCIAFAKYRADA